MQTAVKLSGSSYRYLDVRALRTGCIAVLTALLAGCGSNDADGVTFNGTLDTCALIASVNPDKLLDITDGKAYPVMSMRSDDGTQVTSQCSYTSISTGKTIGLLVKFSSSEINPASKAEFIKSQVAAKYISDGEGLVPAIEAGRDIQGLGDFAFYYRLLRFNLYVFWAKHYQMIVMTSGLSNEDDALKINELVARQVLKAFPGR